MPRLAKTKRPPARTEIERRLGRPQFFSDLKAALRKEFGSRFKGLVLYGSQARGDISPESDVDVLVLLDGPVKIVKESHRAIEATADLALEIDAPLAVIAASAKEFDRAERSFYQNIREDGRWL
ncbi:MAG: nucleotidyltransferase domain-containing protein [Bdellovibrionota bacterium]